MKVEIIEGEVELIYCCNNCGASYKDLKVFDDKRCLECQGDKFTGMFLRYGFLHIYDERRENIVMRIRDWFRGLRWNRY